MQEDILMVADPKGLQYICHTSGYHFPKRPDINMIMRLISGRGIAWASGWYFTQFSVKTTPGHFIPQVTPISATGRY